MAVTNRTELLLPNDVRFLLIARAYVRELSTLAGISQIDTKNLELAIEEACTNTIEFAFEPDEHGTFILRGDLKPGELILSILDHGIPFDHSLAPAYSPPQSNDASQVCVDGMGLYLIRHAADKVDWINHGRDGKELRLTKYLPVANVTEHLSDDELAPFRDNEPQAPPQNYTIRRLRSEEAIWVAQCIYQAYGYSYPEDYLYYPERIAHMNETGDMISVVAADETGKLVGHGAIMVHGFGHVAELDHAVVRPANRKYGLLERITLLLEQEARERKLQGLYVEAVTSHTFSQRVVGNLGYRECALFLGLMPGTLNFKKMKVESKQQRESCAVFYKNSLPPTTSVAHAPNKYKEMLQRIYSHLGMPVEFQAPGDAEDQGKIQVSFDTSLGYGEIKVQQVGKNSAIEIHRALSDLSEITGAETVYLDLPLSQEATPDLCEDIESDGFFFGGLMPSFSVDGDVLRLQHLKDEMDVSRIKMASDFGQSLLAYAAKEMGELRDY